MSITDTECEHYRVRADIDLDAVYENVAEVKKHISDDVKVMLIIKADGYGHGAVPIAKALHGLADGFGVAIVEEGMELRDANVNEPVLILGYTGPEYLDEVVSYDLTQTIFDYDTAKLLSDIAVKQSKKAKVHIKIDTGMNRIGFKDCEESIDEILRIKELHGICAEGIFTHLAKADEADIEAVIIQYKRFTDFVGRLEAAGVHFDIVHAANSAAIIDSPHMKLDMVRCGIATYGLYPSDEVDKIRIVLKPAMSLTSHISYVKTVEAGQGISYNGTFVTTRETKVATIPVGYADGYPRLLSSKGRVLIRGKAAPIIGRICMDQFMVDVTDIPDAARGDKVTLVGTDGDLTISLDEIAALTETINYEVACDISKRVPRKHYFHLWNTKEQIR